MSWCFVNFQLIPKSTLWCSYIISQHYIGLLPQELVAVLTKSPQKDMYCLPTALSVNGLSGIPTFSISDYTAPPIYLRISNTRKCHGNWPWMSENTLNCPLEFHSNILLHMVYSFSAKETQCALNTRVYRCSHVQGICCTWHLEPKLYNCVAATAC